MREILVVAIFSSACGGSDFSTTTENLGLPAWISWESGVAESANESGPACGHECPGSPWTASVGTAKTVSVTTYDTHGVAHLDLVVDWSNVGPPINKLCFCDDPHFLRDKANQEVVFVVSTDEPTCLKQREMWKSYCPSAATH